MSKLIKIRNRNNIKRDEESQEIEVSLDELLGAYGQSSSVMLPDPALVDYYERLENREILWNTDIDEELVEYIQQIIKWNKEDDEAKIPVSERKPCKILINTNGGCLNSVMSFIDILLLSKTPIMTVGYGKCDSAGALLLMAGTKGYRYILNYNECLIHDGSNYIANSTGKLFDQLEFNKKIEEQVKQYVLERTKITSELYDENYRKDWWLTSTESIEYGVADHIVERISQLY